MITSFTLSPSLSSHRSSSLFETKISNVIIGFDYILTCERQIRSTFSVRLSICSIPLSSLSLFPSLCASSQPNRSLPLLLSFTYNFIGPKTAIILPIGDVEIIYLVNASRSLRLVPIEKYKPDENLKYCKNINLLTYLPNLPTYIPTYLSNLNKLPTQLTYLPTQLTYLPTYLFKLPTYLTNLPTYLHNLPT